MKISKKTKNDIILVAVILLIAAAGLLVANLTRLEGNMVLVKIDGNVTQSYSLYENRTVDIVTGDNNEFMNTLVIEDGKAYMSDADCPDKICKEHRPISYSGETIVCLPHRIVIEITAENSVPDLDAVA
ncbi:MAG: NusG domain II-containing protein [Clostridia bacterium]|nr:NusG domain II-containing protein [Clostridia bacterium]